MYLGSFSPDAGVQRGTVDPRTGVLTVGATVPDLPDSSWFAHSADRRIVYVTNELPEGHVSAVDAATGRVLNKQSTHGEAPTHLSVHGQFLLTANYGSGSVVVHRLAGDGTIGESTDLVTHTGAAEAHAHQVLPDPSGRWVVAVDLGTDSVYVYGLDPASGKLRARQQLRLPTGYGPRHLAFHPDGRRAYILGELRSEITVAAWDPSAGLFTPGQVIGTLGDATPPQNFPSEIQVSPDGRFVYAANRGHDSIATFDVRGERLAFAGTTPCGGAWPRHFTLDPTGRWVYVANQRANAVSWLLRDPRTGRLGSPAGSAAVNSACFVLFGRNAR
ncbi:6-phosphogluconolactonase (cycloisomerase 2 family) [Herbihabitans rhizosphaerae]|uniref:6-phosphogluconolactonase (Cycloisomerase 2 family) n=1 Tax=Herbihabitans rhizosphaerae TaxID=1872711 RepID=A0A4Q7L2V0_9PSEU|nr:6-phosphogluconolactonase (cycloisomerase 2 family) [Herbihabitans rhizosphaerae]